MDVGTHCYINRRGWGMATNAIDDLGRAGTIWVDEGGVPVDALSSRRHPSSRIYDVAHYLNERCISAKALDLALPTEDFFDLSEEMGCGRSLATTWMDVHGLRVLRGTSAFIVHYDLGHGSLHGMVDADMKALTSEILRRLNRHGVRELPKSASSNGVSPSAKTIGEVGVTSSAAGRDNGDTHRTANLSHEEKIIAAKEAIAVYAREKNLPSAEMLATFGELDRAKASGGAAAVGVDLPATSGRLLASCVVGRWNGVKWIEAAPANINRHAHRLSSESLGRAADQIWSANSGGTYADLVCSRPERLADMVYRGDSAADGERG
jgi:hypothetical protein